MSETRHEKAQGKERAKGCGNLHKVFEGDCFHVSFPGFPCNYPGKLSSEYARVNMRIYEIMVNVVKILKTKDNKNSLSDIIF